MTFQVISNNNTLNPHPFCPGAGRCVGPTGQVLRLQRPRVRVGRLDAARRHPAAGRHLLRRRGLARWADGGQLPALHVQLRHAARGRAPAAATPWSAAAATTRWSARRATTCSLFPPARRATPPSWAAAARTSWTCPAAPQQRSHGDRQPHGRSPTSSATTTTLVVVQPRLRSDCHPHRDGRRQQRQHAERHGGFRERGHGTAARYGHTEQQRPGQHHNVRPSGRPATIAVFYPPGSVSRSRRHHTGSVRSELSRATPTVSVSDAGGTYNGSAFAASATVTGVSGTGQHPGRRDPDVDLLRREQCQWHAAGRRPDKRGDLHRRGQLPRRPQLHQRQRHGDIHDRAGDADGERRRRQQGLRATTAPP